MEESDHLGGRVDAGYRATSLYEVADYGFACTATYVQDTGVFWLKIAKTVEPAGFDSLRASIFYPRAGMPSIKIHDLVSFAGHTRYGDMDSGNLSKRCEADIFNSVYSLGRGREKAWGFDCISGARRRR